MPIITQYLINFSVKLFYAPYILLCYHIFFLHEQHFHDPVNMQDR